MEHIENMKLYFWISALNLLVTSKFSVLYKYKSLFNFKLIRLVLSDEPSNSSCLNVPSIPKVPTFPNGKFCLPNCIS